MVNLIERLGQDKSLMQPYKNYAISDAKRLHALIRMAGSSTQLEPPVGTQLGINPVCSCPAGGLRKTCAIHGEKI